MSRTDFHHPPSCSVDTKHQAGTNYSTASSIPSHPCPATWTGTARGKVCSAIYPPAHTWASISKYSFLPLYHLWCVLKKNREIPSKAAKWSPTYFACSHSIHYKGNIFKLGQSPKNPYFFLLLRLTIGITGGSESQPPRDEGLPITHPASSFLCGLIINCLNGTFWERRGSTVNNYTRTKGINGTRGYQCWLQLQISQVQLCSLLAQLLWFAVFISFALGLRGWKF